MCVRTHSRRSEQCSAHFPPAHSVWKRSFSIPVPDVFWPQPLFHLARNHTVFRGNPILLYKLHLNKLCLTSLPYPRSKGKRTAVLPKPFPFEHCFPCPPFNSQNCSQYEKRHSKEAKLSSRIIVT